MSGYKELLRRIEPSVVICYGKPFDEMEGNIIHVSYEETNNYSPKEYAHELLRQIPQIPKDLTYEKGGGHAISSNKFPTNDGQFKHMFRKKENHVSNTPENRDLFLRVYNDEKNYLGTDRYGKRWYAQILPDGRQVWVCTRDGVIQNCGINEFAYKDYKELPVFLNARMVADLLGVSQSTAYELMHEKSFPTLQVGSRLVVPKDKFIDWMNGKISR